MIVLKFGGTSVGSAPAMERTLKIIEDKAAGEEGCLVVVSACSGVTDILYGIAEKAVIGEDYTSDIETLAHKHEDIARELGLPPGNPIYEIITCLCDEVQRNADSLASGGSVFNKAALISQGEVFSSRILALCAEYRGMDMAFFYAPFAMKASGSPMSAEPAISDIARLVEEKLRPLVKVNTCVITQGFIASDLSHGLPMVLGRGGSDYSASLFGEALDADRIEIWTDVDGVRSADPRMVADSRGIAELSYPEAAELARFGAKVLHPLTVEPAQRKNIPVYVRNTMNPEAEGTAVLAQKCIPDGVRSIACKENIKVINIYSPKMINAPGFMQRVFSVFGERGVSLDLLSSSEASITVTVDKSQNLDGVVEDLSEFASVQIDRDKSQVSVIGKNLINCQGTLTTIFRALEGYKLYMIAQGASFLNFSVVVDRPELAEVVRRLHAALFR